MTFRKSLPLSALMLVGCGPMGREEAKSGQALTFESDAQRMEQRKIRVLGRLLTSHYLRQP